MDQRQMEIIRTCASAVIVLIGMYFIMGFVIDLATFEYRDPPVKDFNVTAVPGSDREFLILFDDKAYLVRIDELGIVTNIRWVDYLEYFGKKLERR